MHDHPAILTIDLGALAANWRLLAARAAPGECAGVVKADAYGLGIETAVPALVKAGCRSFFVAHLSEGIRARAVAPEAEIYVLNGLATDRIDLYREHRLAPVLGTIAEITAWLEGSAGAPAPVLHIDTGMNRLGLRPDVAREFIAGGGLARLAPALVMSHFVAAEVPDDPITARQIEAFAALAALISNSEISNQKTTFSLCNSSGLFLENSPVHGLARPGYALYGGNPTPGRPNPMAPVIRLEAPVIQITPVPKGEPVGYNSNFIANRDSLIATISCGYADGYPRNAGAKPDAPGGFALINGREVAFAGNVSMDLITLDITALPAGSVKTGDHATLIGDALNIDRVAASASTNGYEILTNLGRRYRRVSVGG